VAGAKSYTVSVNSSTSNNICKLIVQPTTVSGTSYTIPKGKMEIGGAYTVTVSADNSMSASAKLYCFSAEALESNLSDKAVLAFGDSLTARSGWVAMLGGYIGTDVINAGVGGDSTINAVGRLERDVLSKKPDVALVCFGMNDQAQSQSKNAPNVSLEKYTENMIHIIEELQALGTDVILIAPHDAYAANGFYSPGGYGLDYAYGNMKDFCNVVRELAEEYDCGLIDIYAEAEQEDMTKFLAAGDGIHQSPEGHKLWAKYVSEYLLAVYDGKNAVSIPVKAETDGEVLECGSWIMAEGASMYVPVPAGAEGEPKLITAAQGVSVTYTWVGEIPEESTEESTEASEEASETVSEAASATESTGETEETDSSVAIWLICIGAALVLGGCAAFFAKKKK
jgi:lysophospholipase L1-like esterase